MIAVKPAPKPDSGETTADVTSDINAVEANSKAKATPKLKKKAVDVDPFASEDDDDGKTNIEKQHATGSVPTTNIKEEMAPSKPKAKLKLKKKAAADPFASDEEEKGEEQKAEKSKTVRTKRSQSADESDDEEANRPKKIAKK